MSIQRQWLRPSWLYLLAPFCLVTFILSFINKAKKQADSLVWVVGNAAVGGTGKTPVIIAIANWLKQQGKQVVIMASGYHGSNIGPHWVQTSDPVTLVGDEALMLSLQLNIPIIIANDRQKSLQLILEKYPNVDVILSDDGLQDRKLRYAKAIIIKSQQENKYLLPLGPMRTSEKNLQVDFVLSNLESKITGFTDSETGSVVELPITEINAVAAIANPARFHKSLIELGYKVNFFPKPDHYYFAKEDLPNNLPLVVTAKDAVKITWRQCYIANYGVNLPESLILAMKGWL